MPPALTFALAGAAVSVVVGGTLGAIAGTLDAPGRRGQIVITAALLAVPPAFWWIGLTRLPVGLGRLSGLMAGSVVAGLVLAPITMLFVLAATAEIPANAYEAARVSLELRSRVSFVLVPLLRPALLAGFLMTAILLLGESEVPFMFGFRTSMTDLVTTFSQTFDVGRTVPIIVPLVGAVLAAAMLVARPLFLVLLPSAAEELGVVRKPAGARVSIPLLVLPVLAAVSLLGYAQAVMVGSGDIGRRLWAETPTMAVSIAEPVLCACVAANLAVLAAYPARQLGAARLFAVVGLLLFCVPTSVMAIGWITIEQAFGTLSVPPGIAHVSRMVGVAVFVFLIAYSRMPQSLEDAAQLVPLSALRRAWSIILPILGTSLVAVTALMAALIFADRDVASLLLSPGDSRVMLNLYLLSANAPAAIIGATAIAVFVMGGFVVAFAAAVPAAMLLRRR